MASRRASAAFTPCGIAMSGAITGWISTSSSREAGMSPAATPSPPPSRSSSRTPLGTPTPTRPGQPGPPPMSSRARTSTARIAVTPPPGLECDGRPLWIPCPPCRIDRQARSWRSRFARRTPCWPAILPASLMRPAPGRPRTCRTTRPGRWGTWR